MQLFKFVVLFSVPPHPALHFRSFPSLSGPVPRPSPAPTCQPRTFAWLGPCPGSFSHQCHWQMQICLRGCNSGQAPDRGGVSNSHSPTARSQGSHTSRDTASKDTKPAVPGYIGVRRGRARKSRAPTPRPPHLRPAKLPHDPTTFPFPALS